MPYVWDLVLKGVIVPGVGLSNPNFPFYQVTSYGKKVIEEDWFTIHDSGQFISSLVERYGDPGKVAKIFLDECLNAFNKGLYRASVMMLGVATEEIMVMVMTVFLDRVLKGAEKTKFEKLLHSKKLGIAAKTDEFSKRLLPKLELLRGDLRDGLETDLNGMAAIIRRARNDVGHPKEIYVERDEAAGLIQMFPPYWRKSAALMNLWTKKP